MSDTKIKINETTEPFANTYDASPYESYPYINTRPEVLKSVSQVFGLNTPNLETAKVLELGCAAGGNIIPHAINFPKGTYVGVDLSSIQIEQGQKQIKELGLKNITLKAMSITDIDKKFGEFDYIICHGVISWVPKNVQEAIFRVCKENLSKSGIAYVSYNTLPGWNMINSIRDMMMYHTQNFAEPSRKTLEARLLLNFVNDALKEAKTPYAEVLAAEAKLLSQLPDNYLRHDHLEENNHQFYFHDFIKSAAKHDLQYVGDVSLASMYSKNMPKQAAEKLQEITDIVRSEQYMDFITNRRFRTTLLTHSSNKLVRNISNDSIKNLYFSSKLTPEKPLKDVKIDDNTKLHFIYNNEKEKKLDTDSPPLKALLYTLSENSNYPMNVNELTKQVQSLLPTKQYTDEQISAAIPSSLVNLIFAGMCSISSEKAHFMNTPSEKPKISDLARAQLDAKQTWITNQIHDRIGLNIVDLYLVRYMDGSHTKEQIAEAALKHISSGELVINQNDKPVTDPKAAKEILLQYLNQALAAYAKNAIFVS